MNKLERERKLAAMLPKIRADFTRMLNLVPEGSMPVASRVYLMRQIDKYLKPLNGPMFRDQVNTLMPVFQSPPLLNAANNDLAVPGRKPNWDTEGVGPEHESVMLKLGGGWSQLYSRLGRKIRINEKAFWLFPELTLRGVMVHEATHFALDTDDIYYNTFTRHSVMQNLQNGSDNADNWRIFYQKMSTHFVANP